MMRTMRNRKSWFWTMWTMALLAVFGLVASPALASICCCDDMGEAGHSHAATTTQHDHNSHDHDTEHPQVGEMPASFGVVVSSFQGTHRQTQCQVSPSRTSTDQNITSSSAPIVALTVRLFSFQTPNILSVSTFASRVARPRAPDRASCSGLSPPAPLWS